MEASAALGLRNYEDAAETVKQFYATQHAFGTVENAEKLYSRYFPLRHTKMPMWDALMIAKEVRDGSDPDMLAAQAVHFYGTAEKIRSEGEPEWMILLGLIHDGGKVLKGLFGEPDHCVVGDTWPVGCAWSDKIVLRDSFEQNPDSKVAKYQTPTGIYKEHCGFDNVTMWFGHDEYLYRVVRDYEYTGSWPMSDEDKTKLLYVLRYHSFYPWHREGAYAHLASDFDVRMRPLLQRFSYFDLYSKPESEDVPDEELEARYRPLVEKYFPPSRPVQF
jgi:inositol oxygenase